MMGTVYFSYSLDQSNIKFNTSVFSGVYFRERNGIFLYFWKYRHFTPVNFLTIHIIFPPYYLCYTLIIFILFFGISCWVVVSSLFVEKLFSLGLFLTRNIYIIFEILILSGDGSSGPSVHWSIKLWGF